MTAVPIEHGEGLERVVELAARLRGRDVVTVTEHGQAVAVVLSAGEWAAIRETLDIVMTPGEAEALDEGIADLDAGREVDGAAFLEKFRAGASGDTAGTTRHENEPGSDPLHG